MRKDNSAPILPGFDLVRAADGSVWERCGFCGFVYTHLTPCQFCPRPGAARICDRHDCLVQHCMASHPEQVVPRVNGVEDRIFACRRQDIAENAS